MLLLMFLTARNFRRVEPDEMAFYAQLYVDRELRPFGAKEPTAKKSRLFTIDTRHDIQGTEVIPPNFLFYDLVLQITQDIGKEAGIAHIDDDIGEAVEDALLSAGVGKKNEVFEKHSVLIQLGEIKDMQDVMDVCDGFKDFIYLVHGDHKSETEALNLETATVSVGMVKKNAACSGCEKKFKSRETFKILTCKHMFHPKCVIPTVRVTHSCPTCNNSKHMRDISMRRLSNTNILTEEKAYKNFKKTAGKTYKYSKPRL